MRIAHAGFVYVAKTLRPLYGIEIDYKYIILKM